jgi:hypothetical protein
MDYTKICFVVMPFGSKPVPSHKVNFNHIKAFPTRATRGESACGLRRRSSPDDTDRGESVGRQGDAIDMLTKADPRGTDPIGVLAGRLKRRWLVEHKRSDAEQALSLYGQALARAERKPDAAQLSRDQVRLHEARI